MSIQFSEAMEDYGAAVLQEDTTVNFNSSMTRNDIQALIDAQPKNLGGYDLTFQFADGTYTLNNPLYFQNFHNGGIKVYGNSSDNDLSTSKSVHLDFSGADCDGLYFSINESCVYVYYLKATVDTSTNSRSPMQFIGSSNSSTVAFCYCLGTNDGKGSGVLFNTCQGAFVYKTYVSNVFQGIAAYTGIVFSNGNDDTGTPPKYGLASYDAGVIGKNGDQPSGSTANEYTTRGGTIR